MGRRSKRTKDVEGEKEDKEREKKSSKRRKKDNAVVSIKPVFTGEVLCCSYY